MADSGPPGGAVVPRSKAPKRKKTVSSSSGGPTPKKKRTRKKSSTKKKTKSSSSPKKPAGVPEAKVDAPPIEVIAARTRVYQIVDRATNRVKNSEGLVFTIPAGDVKYVGEYDKIEKITKTEMINVVMRHRGFTYMEFTKVDGSNRQMYCSFGKMRANDVYLEDLKLGQASSERRCKLDRIHTVVSGRTLYKLK